MIHTAGFTVLTHSDFCEIQPIRVEMNNFLYARGNVVKFSFLMKCAAIEKTVDLTVPGVGECEILAG
jgi:hypothetical protein